MTPEELDEARAKEAFRFWHTNGGKSIATIAARLAREGWTPPEPEPVDPDVLAFREWAIAVSMYSHAIPEIQRGELDKVTEAQAYLAGARMAREQEQERAKGLVERVEIYAGPHDAVVLSKNRGEW